MNPLTPQDIAIFTVIFLSLLTLLGDLLRRLLEFFFKRNLFSRPEIIPANIAFGSVGLPIIVLCLTPFRGLQSTAVLALSIIIVSAEVLILARKETGKKIRLDKTLIGPIIPLLIFLPGLMLRVAPTVGAYGGPMDDMKMHTLLTNLIVGDQGFPDHWGRYAPPGYETSPIRYPLVFHSISAFFTLLTGIPSSETLFLVTQIFNALIPLSVFLLVSKMFNYRSAVLSALILSVISAMPLASLGGNAEIYGIFIAFFVATIFIETQISNYKDLVLCILLSIFVIESHLYAFYLVFQIVGLYFLWKYVESRSPEQLYNVFMCIGLPICLDLLLDYSRYVPSPLKQSYLIFDLNTYHLVSHWDWIRGLTPFIDVFGYPFVLLTLLSVSFFADLDRRELFFDGCWILVPSFVVLNSLHDFPIKFPFWYIVQPERMFFLLAYPLTFLTAASLSRKSSQKKMIRIPPISLSAGKYTLSTKQFDVYKVSLLLVVGFLVLQSTLMNNERMNEVKDKIIVSQEDIVAFEWIQRNIEENATFFTCWSDGGGWLPVFAQRRGIPTMFNVYEDWMLEEYFIETGWELNGWMISNPDNPRVLQLISKYNITHVYSGDKTIIDRPPLNPQLFLDSSNYEIVYHPEGSNVYIFKVKAP